MFTYREAISPDSKIVKKLNELPYLEVDCVNLDLISDDRTGEILVHRGYVYSIYSMAYTFITGSSIVTDIGEEDIDLLRRTLNDDIMFRRLSDFEGRLILVEISGSCWYDTFRQNRILDFTLTYAVPQ